MTVKRKYNKKIKFAKWWNNNVWITSLMALCGLLLSTVSIWQNHVQFEESNSSSLFTDCSIPDSSKVSLDTQYGNLFFDVICNISNKGNKSLTISGIDSVKTYNGNAVGYEIVPSSKVENAPYKNLEEQNNTLPYLLASGELVRY